MKTVGCTVENKRGENMIIQVCRSICVIYGSSFFSPLSKPNGRKETQKNRSGSVQLVGPNNPQPSNSRRSEDDGNEVGRAKVDSRYLSLGLAGVHWAELWRCPSQGLISIAVFCWLLIYSVSLDLLKCDLLSWNKTGYFSSGKIMLSFGARILISIQMLLGFSQDSRLAFFDGDR